MEEHVLTAPAHLLDSFEAWLGLKVKAGGMLESILEPSHLAFRPRRQVETDPSFKQLIPYAVLISGPLIFGYRRGNKGGESRLHDLWSIGVGGHISQEDGEPGASAYRAGFERELSEEVDIQTTWRDETIGLLYDPRTAVGEVHLGILHYIWLDAPLVLPRDPSMCDAGFEPLSVWRQRFDQLETWSQFAMEPLLALQ